MNVPIEEIKAIMASPEMGTDAVLLAGQKIYRANYGGKRYYLNEREHAHVSVTTFLGLVMPTNRFLENWRADLASDLGSKEAVDEYVNVTAEYGTALHIAIADLVEKGEISWAELHDWFAQYLVSTTDMKPELIGRAATELVRDFAGLAQFLHDYNVKVIAVELPVMKSIDGGGLATCIDLVVEMDCKNYVKATADKSKRQKAIINLKSGKKGFYESHFMQLIAERYLFNEMYGSLLGEIEAIYNVAPSDWRKTPGYKVKKWEPTATDVREFELYLELAKIKGYLNMPEQKKMVFHGTLSYGQNPSECLNEKGLLDFILEHKKIQEAHHEK